MANFTGTSVDYDRQRRMLNERMKEKIEFEAVKKKLADESNKGLVTLNQQFSRADLSTSDIFKTDTVGLISAEAYRDKRKSMRIDKLGEKRTIEDKVEENILKPKKIKVSKEKQNFANLSFDPFEDETEIVENVGNIKKIEKTKKSLKNPFVDTSFLPDKERDRVEKVRRKELKTKWFDLQEKIKHERVELTYDYWDGAGHRKKMIIEKRDSIRYFLERAKEELGNHFSEFRSAAIADILFIKSDSIIPQTNTFYDLIQDESEGKSGKLFILESDYIPIEAEVSGDILTVQTDIGNVGKIVIRSWYDRNRHMYPASEWDIFGDDTTMEL